MLQFVIGTAGTGKSDYMMKKAAETAMTQSEPVLFIVPEQASFYYEKQMLRLLGEKNADKVEVLSFSRLCDNVLGSGMLPPISEGGKAVLMSLALESLSEKLTVYNRYTKSLSVANELLKLSTEFKRCTVSPEKLYNLSGSMPDGFLKKKLSEIALILDTYDVLVSQNYSDDTDNLTRLAQYASEHSSFADKVIFVDPFSGFTMQEYDVLEQMMIQAKTIYISLTTDSLFNSSNYDPTAFSYIRKTASKLMHRARKCNVSIATPIVCEENRRFKSDDLFAVEKIFSAYTAHEYAGESPAVTVAEAPGVYEECAFVAASVKRMMREEGYRCREIAVLFHDAQRYEAAVRTALGKCGVPVFEDKRQPIMNQPLIAMVRGLCAIAAHGFSTERVMQILKTGLLDLTGEQIADLENYALLWDIRAGGWKRPFTMHPEGYGKEKTDESEARLEELEALRVAAVRPMEQFAESVRDVDGEGFARSIFTFLRKKNVAESLRELSVRLEEQDEQVLALEQERVWDILMEILDMFAHTLKGKNIPPERFEKYLDVVLSTYSLGNIPQGLDEVLIGDVDRTVMASPRAVFVMGVQEGEFPKTPSSGGLLSLADRKQLKEREVELYDFGEVKVSEERFLVYKTMTAASERLVLTTSAVSEDGTEQCASEVIRLLRESIPSLQMLKIAERDMLSCVESDATAFEQLCLHTQRKDGIYAELRAHFENHETYKTRLDSLKRLCERGAFRISDPALSEKLFGRNMYLSASRVEYYYKCPFAYYCRHGIKAAPREPAKFDSRVQGTEVHFVLETLLRDYSREDLLAMSVEQRQEKIDAILDAYLQTHLGGAEKTSRFMYLYNRMRKTMSEILERLIMEFQVCNFVPVDFELKIDKDAPIPTYVTEIPQGGTVQIRGSIDRVDKLEYAGQTYVRIVDYKSGGKDFELSEVLSGLNMQMLLYLFALWKNGESYYNNPVVPAGILYMPAKAEFEKVPRDTSEEDIRLSKLKSMRMSGMVLDNDEILLQMDNNDSGLFIPATIKKKKTSKLISLSQLSKLREKAEELLCQMALELRAGNIEALPTRVHGAQFNACTYCDYRSVCGREDDMPEREVEKYKHSDTRTILDEGEVQTDAVD